MSGHLETLKSVELFAGAGGLALGVSNAGFNHSAVIEWDHDACETIRLNQRRNVAPVSDWPLHEADVTKFPFEELASRTGDVDLLAAGVPCQPWSMGGKHRGFHDERNLFPDTLRVIRALKPKVVLIENVKGLTRRSFANYFEYIKLMLEFPEVTRSGDESWMDHRARLEKHRTGGKHRGLHYNIVCQLLNAADYGVPQRRERIFIVGFRSDIAARWSFPKPTHSLDALLADQWVTGVYWDRHRVKCESMAGRLENRVDRLRLIGTPDLPWQTVRDAIHDLPDPERRKNISVANHDVQPGARAYTGHTGSPLDEPAKTLKAGDHGVPGGENMVAYPDGRVRYFTVRESARIQTFPDNYVFSGSWTEAMRQLGNAVPVQLAQVIASDIRKKLTVQLS
jgi:DNA (cytosine-5)-methyltransferase 1